MAHPLLWMLVACISVVPTVWSEGRAKAIGQFSVIGEGQIVRVKSPQSCLNHCNLRPDCDAANYYAKKHKCLLIRRCSPTMSGINSRSHFFYAKRPRITSEGYTYHPESDSCLKVIEELVDFATADKICREEGGNLVTVDDPSINEHATELLRNSNGQFAWIGLVDNNKEGDPMHLETAQRVSDTGFFPTAPHGLQEDPSTNCWSLTDSGEWKEHSCRFRKHYSICQIGPYKTPSKLISR